MSPAVISPRSSSGNLRWLSLLLLVVCSALTVFAAPTSYQLYVDPGSTGWKFTLVHAAFDGSLTTGIVKYADEENAQGGTTQLCYHSTGYDVSSVKTFSQVIVHREGFNAFTM
jgi:hypothetical protein